MKRIIKICSLVLCIATMLTCSACKDAPEKVSLSEKNILDYVFLDINFGEVDVHDNPSVIYSSNKYYLTCLATISVKPKGDFCFEEASVFCEFKPTDSWIPLQKSNLAAMVPDSKRSYIIQLDKDGYGEKNVLVYRYDDYFDKRHPSSVEWNLTASSPKGTVTPRH